MHLHRASAPGEAKSGRRGRPALARARSAAAAASALLAMSALGGEAPRGNWEFGVTLDGRPIGSHRFRVAGEGEARAVASEARFTVKILGFTAYRYRHDASERWQGDCLASITASTDDNGERSEVNLEPAAEPSRVHVADAAPQADACVMSFAYWHPAMRRQTRLLNAQTGKLEAVQVRAIDDASIPVRGVPAPAKGWRITGPARPIDVWYDAEGRWIGLDTVVGGHRKLSYRLQ